MSATDHSRFDDLVSRYLDSVLADAEEHELLSYLADETLASRFFEMTKLNAEIEGLMAGSMADEVMAGLVMNDIMLEARAGHSSKRVPSSPKKRGAYLLALAAVIVGLLAVSAVFFFHGSAPVSAAEINSVTGEVYVIGASGQVPVTSGQAFKGDGTLKTVGSDSRATLVLVDGTQIKLLGNTTFAEGTESGKRHLYLRQGALQAIVAKQSADAPLIFNSMEATATVHGTELFLIQESVGSYLVVLKGTVGVHRSSGGPEILIEAGYYSHIEESGPYHSWPISRLPRPQWDQVMIQK